MEIWHVTQQDSVLVPKDTQARNVRNAKWDSMGSLLAKIANVIWLDQSIQYVMNLVFALAKQELVEIGAPDACSTCSAFPIVKVSTFCSYVLSNNNILNLDVNQ